MDQAPLVEQLGSRFGIVSPQDGSSVFTHAFCFHENISSGGRGHCNWGGIRGFNTPSIVDTIVTKGLAIGEPTFGAKSNGTLGEGAFLEGEEVEAELLRNPSSMPGFLALEQELLSLEVFLVKQLLNIWLLYNYVDLLRKMGNEIFSFMNN